MCSVTSGTIFGVSSTAHAQRSVNADEAELQFQRGASAYSEGRFEDALEHFLASNRLVPNVNVLYNIAKVYERLERPADAHRYYVESLASEEDPATRADIEQSLTRLAAEVAVLDVTSDPPGARIYLQRRDLGVVGITPRPLAVSPGSYQVIVELDGYRVHRTEPIEVQRGRAAPVAVTLERIVGTIALEGEAGVEARLGSSDAPVACVVPCSIAAPPGRHFLHLSKPGRAPSERAVTVSADRSTTVRVSLAELTGSLLVQADERGALVEVDGRPQGFTPSVIPNVPVGTRRVRVSLRGYQAEEREVAVEQGRETLLDDIRLVPLREVAAASRTTERIEDAPASITIISSQELEAFQYPTIYEALRGTRGFALTFDSIYGNAAIRGLGQPNDYNNRMLLLSDGATLNENILSQAFIHYDGRVDLGDVERIEVVRGPGSVIYGTGAVSGVVNLVPHSRDEPTGGQLQIGTADRGVARARGGVNYRGPGGGGFRASVSAARAGGWNGELSLDTDGDGVDDRVEAHGINTFEAISSTGRGWAGPFTVQYLYSFRRIRIPTGSFDSTFDDLRNLYDDHRGMLELRFEPKLTEHLSLMVRAHADFYLFKLEYLYEVDDPIEFEQPYFEDYLGIWGGAEARLNYTPIDALRLSLGAEVNIHPQVQIGASQLELDGTTTDLLDTNPTYQVYAAYLLADARVTSWLRLNAGARLDVWRLAEGADDFVSVNPRLAIIVQPTKRDNIKLMGGRAFRAPSAYEYFYTDGEFTTLPSNCCGDQLKPETFYQAELEYSHRFDHEWIVLGSLHALLAQDFIGTLPVPTDPELVYFGNIDEDQLIGGVDLEVRRDFRGGWMFAGMIGYLEARFLSAPSADGATESTRIPNAPRLYGSVRGIVPVVQDRLTLAARLSLDAPRRIALDGSAETEWAVFGDLVLTGHVDEYGLRYSFGVYNVFDWKVNLPVNPFLTQTLPQQGRSFLASVTLDI